MQTQLLTAEDLMKRWQVERRTINNYMNAGIISKVEGLGCVRFNPKLIEAIEGKLDERKTWREIQLEEEIKALQIENQRLKTLIGETIGNLSSGLK